MTSMKSICFAMCLVAGLVSLCLQNDETAQAQPVAKPASKASASKDPYGIDKRVPWTTSRFRGTPEPPLPYRAERSFPKLSFKSPTVLTNAPATDRLFVAEQHGKIFSIP